jgi:predicted YcjX-like family ATPase
MKYKTPSERSKFFVPKEDYITAIHWCLRYPLWVAELKLLPDTNRSMAYENDRVQNSARSDITADTVIRIKELERKIELLEDTAKKVDEDLKDYIILGVTQGLTVFQLLQRGMPCNKNEYIKKRQQFYYEISKKI